MRTAPPLAELSLGGCIERGYVLLLFDSLLRACSRNPCIAISFCLTLSFSMLLYVSRS